MDESAASRLLGSSLLNRRRESGVAGDERQGASPQLPRTRSALRKARRAQRSEGPLVTRRRRLLRLSLVACRAGVVGGICSTRGSQPYRCQYDSSVDPHQTHRRQIPPYPVVWMRSRSGLLQCADRCVLFIVEAVRASHCGMVRVGSPLQQPPCSAGLGASQRGLIGSRYVTASSRLQPPTGGLEEIEDYGQVAATGICQRLVDVVAPVDAGAHPSSSFARLRRDRRSWRRSTSSEI